MENLKEFVIGTLISFSTIVFVIVYFGSAIKIGNIVLDKVFG